MEWMVPGFQSRIALISDEAFCDFACVPLTKSWMYPLGIKHGNGKFTRNGGFQLGNSLINGPLSIAIFDYQRVNQNAHVIANAKRELQVFQD